MNNWISIKEKLPQIYERVLAYDTCGWISILSLVNKNTWEDEYGYLDTIDKVLYWMPLPKFDKEV